MSDSDSSESDDTFIPFKRQKLDQSGQMPEFTRSRMTFESSFVKGSTETLDTTAKQEQGASPDKDEKTGEGIESESRGFGRPQRMGFMGFTRPKSNEANESNDANEVNESNESNETEKSINERHGLGANLDAELGAGLSAGLGSGQGAGIGSGGSGAGLRVAMGMTMGFSQSPERSSPPVSAPSNEHSSTYGIGAKLLGKMGYVPGKGLGKEGKGIVEPIEQKLRPSLLGLGGIDEKTRQARLEERRKKALEKGFQGLEDYTDDEEDDAGDERRNKSQRPTPKPKTLYKTIVELEQEGLHVPSGFRNIVNMSRPEGSAVEDLASFRSSNDNTPVPEMDSLVLYDRARGELDQYAGEWKALQTRKRDESSRLKLLESQLDQILHDISRIKQVVDAGESLLEQGEAGPSIDNVVELIDKIQTDFLGEIEDLQLDQLAVAAISPFYSKEVSNWDPLTDPTLYRDKFVHWKMALGITRPAPSASEQKAQASAFETLIYTTWFPRVQSCLVNEWDHCHPSSAILLLEEWETLIPTYVKQALLDRAIIPRLKKSISSWKPRAKQQASDHEDAPHEWLFPWLPYLDQHEIDNLVSEIKSKFSTILQAWRPSRGIPIPGLSSWADFLGSDQMDELLVNSLLPRLGQYLRRELEINPANQNMEPLEHVLEWKGIIKPSIFGIIFGEHVFPKWLDVLHKWLTDPDARLHDISAWYEAWYEWIPSDLRDIPAIKRGFNRGLDLINAALDLDAKDRQHKLELPKHEKVSSAPSQPARPSMTEDLTRPKPIASFREVVEAYCMSHDLFLLPLRKAHEVLGHALYKISDNPAGHGGRLCYFEDDVLWLQSKTDRKSYEPVSLDDTLEI
uniref:ARAD1A18678p n=1 Tax=Blastobotrys adeninivorans TaxID=409370 RepID=A0A060SZ92_BLAAD